MMEQRRSFEKMGREFDELWREQKEKQMEEQLMNASEALVEMSKGGDRNACVLEESRHLRFPTWYRIGSGLEESMDRGENWGRSLDLTPFINATGFRKVRPEEWFDYREPKEEPAQEDRLPDELSVRELDKIFCSRPGLIYSELSKRILRQVARMIAESKGEK